MIVGEINAAFSIVERIVSFLKKKGIGPVDSVARRFISLFESHGVHRAQIPRFFGRGIELSDLFDHTTLVPKLTENTLKQACEMFAVRREWLDGVNPELYPKHMFYKSPEAFQDFVSELMNDSVVGALNGYLITTVDKSSNGAAAFILEEAVGQVGEEVIYRYHVCDQWDLGYWKSRAYLVACVAIAWKKSVFIQGRFGSKSQILRLSADDELIGPLVRNLVSIGQRWYPEDMALVPETYLHGLDQGANDFSARAALDMWLGLDDDGWMDTGLSRDVRSAFELERSKFDTYP